MNLGERLLAIHASLDDAKIEHAIGGAIALAYWTQEPRGTRDIDVNVFVAPKAAQNALAALPPGVAHNEATLEAIQRDGQVRLWWEDTPVDLFFSNLPIHDKAERHRRLVPFEGARIPVLAPLELAFFKTMSDRTRHWADMEEMLRARAFDPKALETLIIEHVGENNARVERLAEAVRLAG